MKRNILLISVSGVIIAVMLNFYAIFSLTITGVEVVSLKKAEHKESVYATGKIEEKNTSEITYDIPIVTSDVYVDIGDQVKVGDIIAKVDVSKTKDAILDILKLADIIPSEYSSYISALGFDVSSLDLDNLDIQSISSIIPSEITADYSGVITNLNATIGAVNAPAQAVATISTPNDLRAKISVNETYADSIQAGQKVSLYVEALKTTYDGTISLIFPTAHEAIVGTSKETLVNLYVKLNDYDSSLKSGYSVLGEITTQEAQLLNTLPYEAINQDENNLEYVYVFNKSKAEKRYITTGVEFQERVEILSGISETDIVILNNKDIKKENQLVKIEVNSMGEK